MANVANVVINWLLIFGKLGAPAMGVRGAAWATVASRVVMAGYLLVVILIRERGRRPGLFETPFEIKAGLAAPARSRWASRRRCRSRSRSASSPPPRRSPGRLAPAALAAHQIAINIAACAFMVPLGLASAGAVRVGHAVGRRDPDGAERAGWTALLFGVGFMGGAAASVRPRPAAC